MQRPARSKLSPWIESLILSHGGQEEEGNNKKLKAHVIGVGQMSQSQAQGSDGPSGLLFLSDGFFQIPAILTASAWQHLQEQEDRESFTSLLNTTLFIQDYQLQFYMAPEQTKCRFFLSVGELATTAAGPVKNNTPCCTTLPSIRQKICKTWRAMLGQEVQDFQASQSGFDLSELLGEWQHDCLQTVLDDVRERLIMVSSHPVIPQPLTSTSTSLPTHLNTFKLTNWDVDRVRDKGVKYFSVPTKCLLIPEEDAQQLQTAPNVGSRTPIKLPAVLEDGQTDLPYQCSPERTVQTSDDDAERCIARTTLVETNNDANENSPLVEDEMSVENMITGIIDSDIRHLANPWDIFSPPDIISSSPDASPDVTPNHSPQNTMAFQSKPDNASVLTSTQLPALSSKEFGQTSEISFLPPYQRHPDSGSSASTSVSPSKPFNRLLKRSPTTDEQQTEMAQRNSQTVDQESHILENNKTYERKSKKKRSEPTPEAKTDIADEEEEGAEISTSPPSWLFDSQTDLEAKEDSQTERTVLRQTPTVHGDGKPFSYTYQGSGKDLQDFSHFQVAQYLLEWAVKYLLAPKSTDYPDNKSVTSNLTTSNRTDTTSAQMLNNS